jgi:ABC-2 type transport system ATP-binding protein
MLAARGLGKCYPGGHWAVRELSLEVGDGELVMLLGANGAGKSTTISCFLDFITPTEGQVEVDGRPVRADPWAARRRLAYVPELVTVYDGLTGIENLRYFARLGTGRDIGQAAAVAALAAYGLSPESMRRRVVTYSKGMRQKLGLAVAAVRGAGNLILDEPTSGLDPLSALELMAALRSLRDAGRAILMSTHDIHRARQHADRIYILQGGRVRGIVDGDEVRRVDLEQLYSRVTRAEHGEDA